MASEPKKRGVQPDGMRYYSGTGTYLDNSGKEYVSAEQGGRAGYLEYGPGRKAVPGTWKSSGEMNPKTYYRGSGTHTDGSGKEFVRADLHGKPGFVQRQGGKNLPETWHSVTGPEYVGTGGIVYDMATGRAKNAPMSYTQEERKTPSVDTSSVNLGTNTSATRAARKDVKPTPTSVEQAYSYMDPSAYGGRRLGDLNTEGFIDGDAFTTGDMEKAGKDAATQFNLDSSIIGSDLGKDVDLGKYKGAFTGSAENAGDAFTTDYSDVTFDAPAKAQHNLRGTLAGLRANEKAAGIVYASGAYWMDGPDGKLQKITMGMTGGGKEGQEHFTANRTQAMAFAANKLNSADNTAPDGQTGGVQEAETVISPKAPADDPKAVKFEQQLAENVANSTEQEVQLYDENGPIGKTKELFGNPGVPLW